MTKKEILEAVKFDEKGLVVCVMQDYHAKKIRMVAYMNKEALEKTLETKEMYYYSRSRNELWRKGETSGYFQHMKGLSIDCDGDALLFQIEQVGGISCHTGHATCFYRDLDEDIDVIVNRTKIEKSDSELFNLEATIKDRIENPVAGSYTNYLFKEGINKILKKFGEEACETIIAAKTNRDDVIYEVSDLMYHLTVLMVELGISWDEIKTELEKR